MGSIDQSVDSPDLAHKIEHCSVTSVPQTSLIDAFVVRCFLRSLEQAMACQIAPSTETNDSEYTSILYSYLLDSRYFYHKPTNYNLLMDDTIVAIDTTGRITYWNPQAEQIYNLRAEEVIGKQLNLLQIECSDTDIIESKLVEQQIREQSALIEIATDAILVVNLEGKIIFGNQSVERVYGWHKSEFMGKYAREIFYDKLTLDQLELPLKKVLQTGEWVGELNQIHKDGRKIIVAARWRIMRDEKGQPKSILTTATDITDKKLLEAQFLRTQRLQNIGALASGIAHDLNNVLTPILAVAQLLPLKLPDMDDNTQELLKIVLSNCRRGSDLIKQILSFARGTEVKRTILQVGHLLVEVARIARRTFPKSIEVCMDISTRDLWTVFADATQLHQVFMNLCLNARDAMPHGGNLTLAMENLFVDENYATMHLDARVGAYVVITISDTGCGIKSEILDHIFDPFFTTKELTQGTGLGLSTVMDIVKSHGGFIKVDSQVGKGTNFQIYLPAVEGTIKPKSEDLEPQLGAGELILVVDDEESILEITKTSLETYNYKALLAPDGIEAIAQFAKHEQEIKAVLLDFMMPSLDSLTIIRTLQKLNPQVPIIVMSGLTSNEIITQLATLGIEAFLAKPFTAWKLLNTLQGILADRDKLMRIKNAH